MMNKERIEPKYKPVCDSIKFASKLFEDRIRKLEQIVLLQGRIITDSYYFDRESIVEDLERCLLYLEDYMDRMENTNE